MAEIHVCAELTTHEKPKGKVAWYIVTCTCGWKSQRTKSWRRSLDNHFYRWLARSGDTDA